MVDWYTPGFKAGGPIRSAVNFADQLENDFDIYVLTTERDLNETSPYKGIEADKWIQRSAHHVFYASPDTLQWGKLKEVIVAINPDFIYLNSMFSKYFTIYPLLMKKMGVLHGRLVLAPRGMLKASALQHKHGKKKIFISLFKLLGLSNDLIFHATDDTEEKDVKAIFGNNVSLFKAGNLPGKQKAFKTVPNKLPGSLKMVFVGRVHPIKNLDFLLRAIKGLNGKIELTIIATLEDLDYWEMCQLIIKSFPQNIQVNTLIDLPHEKIEENIQSNHIFVLPTKGENFGHSIFESLASGRPVLISDQTPWRNLEQRKAGWDLSINDDEGFKEIIQKIIGMDVTQLSEWCMGAWKHAELYSANSGTKKEILHMFAEHA
jgi:glycosyltransferase involved in cell wall biosynthesis